MKKIFRVVSQGEAFTIPSQKTESGHTYKSNIVLQEIGDRKHANTYVAALLGNSATCKFYSGDLVAAVLKFSVHEHNGQTYQDVTVDDIITLKSY
jgi:hypothetical protein